MARPKSIDDSSWPEVRDINGYAVLMAYILMAVRGLSILVFTWTTVVLLGGFVSALQKKDFWCLTVITLVQIIGAFDVIRKEELRHVKYLPPVFDTVDKILTRRPETGTPCLYGLLDVVLRRPLGFVVAYSQVWLGVIVSLGMVIVSWFGLYMNAGISLWRLIERDYANSDGDRSQANMTPALDALYTLALIQGALYFYRRRMMDIKVNIANHASKSYEFGDEEYRKAIEKYSDQTRLGCAKHPSFAEGRNLVTYAVDLMGSTSPADYYDGIRILGTIIGPFSRQQRTDEFIGQRKMIKQLIGSASSSHIIQKLLQVLDVRSPYDREMRKHTARIVAHVADKIRLEQFPRGIQCISSLVEPFEDWYVRDWNQQAHPLPSSESEDSKDYKELLLQGLCILPQLAADEDNCRVMSETLGLLPKITAPVTFHQFHRDRGLFNAFDEITAPVTFHQFHRDRGLFNAFDDIIELSLLAMCRLVVASGDTGARMHREIWRNKETISTMERILKCEECKGTRQIAAMEILTNLYMDIEGRETFIKLVVDIFIDDNKGSEIRGRAGEALAKLSLNSESSARVILKTNDDIVDRLGKILLDVENKYRIIAAEILEHLCIHYTNHDDEYFGRLKKALNDAMPEVLGEILCCGFAEDETHTRTQVNDNHDTENPPSDYQHSLGKSSSSHPQATLLSLCVTVCDRLISADRDLAHQFHAIAPGNGARSFPRKLKEMVGKNMYRRPDCLRMLKLISKMVISMMKHRGRYLKQDLDSLMESLSSASPNMFFIDGCMVFASGDGGATTTMPERTLESLLDEAWELVCNYKEEESEVIAASTSVSGEP